MILALMPAPLVRVTASTLVPSDRAPKGARVAVAALAPAINNVVHSAVDAMPRMVRFIIPPRYFFWLLTPISQTNRAPHKPAKAVYYDASQQGVRSGCP